MKKIAQLLIKWLSKLAYEKITVDSLNKKVIEAVPGLLIDGKQAYQFANPADMPEGRYVNFLQFRQELFGGLDREQNIDLFKRIAEANNQGDYSKAGAICMMGMDILQNCTPIEAYYNMASLIYFTKEEDLKTWDADYNLKKIEGFKAQKNKDFFLQSLSSHLTRYGITSPANIEDYLRKSALKMRVLNSLISEPTGKKPTSKGKKQ